MPVEVRHNHEKSRFEYGPENSLAKLDYKLKGNRLIAYHTEVPDEFEGQGVGSALAQALFDHAREQGITVVPLCSFVAGWLKRHPEYQAITSDRS
jgi:predicted GNAT family acetyltransferase